MKWRMILSILCQLQYLAYSHYNGVSTSVCESMLPNHSCLPQETGNPYKLSLNTTSYTNGSVISVILRSQDNTTFKGYMIQMRRTDNDSIVGRFSVVNNGKLMTCGNMINSTVTHSENSEKHAATFNWISPSTPVGQIRIV